MTASPRITRREFLIGGGAFAATAATVGLHSYGPGRHHLGVVYHEVFISDLPAAFDGFQIAQISDFHFGPIDEVPIVQHAVEVVNSLQPDLVALTGDFVTYDHFDNQKNLAALNLSASVLSGLKTPLKYASIGNHDAPNWVETIHVLRRHGIKILRNRCTPLDIRGSRLWIAGLADVMFDDPDPLLALPLYHPGQPVITLGHEPDYVDDLTEFAQQDNRRCDLMMAGHTHGGQVNIPVLRRIGLPTYGRKYVHGPFQVGQTLLYVNRGLGTIHLPIRFMAPPEVTLYKLRSRKT